MGYNSIGSSCILLLAGGLDALQTAAIIAALPFSVIMILMTVSLIKSLIQERKAIDQKEARNRKEMNEELKLIKEEREQLRKERKRLREQEKARKKEEQQQKRNKRLMRKLQIHKTKMTTKTSSSWYVFPAL